MPEEPKQSAKEKQLRQDTFIADGYQSLFDAVEDVGRALYPAEWTGEERRYTGALDQYARSNLEQELRNTIKQAAHDLARNDKKYRKTIPQGKYGTTQITNDEAFRVARENPKVGLELREKIAIMVARRDDVEARCLKALYGSPPNLPPKCSSYFKQNDGAIVLFKESLWGTPEGRQAIQSEFPGRYNKGTNLSIQIADGTLTTAVVKMVGEKHGNQRAIKNPTKFQIVIDILNKLFPDKITAGLDIAQIQDRVRERLEPGVTISDGTIVKAIAEWRK